MNINYDIGKPEKQSPKEIIVFHLMYKKTEIGKTICSFLNTTGGRLFIGAANEKSMKGINNPYEKKDEIEKYLLEEIVPTAPISISVEIIEKKEMILIEVNAGTRKPYIFDGSIYYIKDSEVTRATSVEIYTLINERQASDEHWERQPVLGLEYKDLDNNEIRNTMIAAEKDNKLRMDFKDQMDFLSYYGLFQNGYFTKSAAILFAKETSRFIPQSRIRLSILKSGKTGAEFIHDQFLEGNLFDNIKKIELFFKQHLMSTRSFSDRDWVRKDDYIFPLEALREGVLNALIHRDYADISSTASILIYSKKVEIINSGTLPFKVIELTRNHRSIPVNPDIAYLVFLRGYIEKIGRGTLKMIEACKKSKITPPKWTEGSNGIKLTFSASVKIEGVSGGVNEGVNKDDNEGVIEGVIGGINEGVTEGVKSIFVTLLLTIGANEGKRIPFLADHISKAVKSVERYIKQLRDYGLIEYKGSSKTGGYYLSDKLKRKLKF